MSTVAEDFARKHDILARNALDCREGRMHLAPALYSVTFESGTKLRICHAHARRLIAAIKAHGRVNAAGQTIVSVVSRKPREIQADKESANAAV